MEVPQQILLHRRNLNLPINQAKKWIKQALLVGYPIAKLSPIVKSHKLSQFYNRIKYAQSHYSISKTPLKILIMDIKNK